MSGYDKLLDEYKIALAYIERLEHQHRNDEVANQLLLAEIQRLDAKLKDAKLKEASCK